MSYKMIITKTVENPNYDAQKAEYDQRKYMHQDHFEHPKLEIENHVLEVELTEAEFLTVKKAVIEVIK